MSGAPGDDRRQMPGTYARYRQIIDDPTTRDALLLQVRSLVGGLRGAYRWHVLVAVFGIAALVYAKPDGWLGRLQWAIVGVAVVVDVLSFLGLRTVARAPTRWLYPLLAVDALVAVGLPVLAAVDGRFHVGWLLLLVLPAMLVVYLRDARSLSPLLAEHDAYRRRQAGGTTEA